MSKQGLKFNSKPLILHTPISLINNGFQSLNINSLRERLDDLIFEQIQLDEDKKEFNKKLKLLNEENKQLRQNLKKVAERQGPNMVNNISELTTKILENNTEIKQIKTFQKEIKIRNDEIYDELIDIKRQLNKNKRKQTTPEVSLFHHSDPFSTNFQRKVIKQVKKGQKGIMTHKPKYSNKQINKLGLTMFNLNKMPPSTPPPPPPLSPSTPPPPPPLSPSHLTPPIGFKPKQLYPRGINNISPKELFTIGTDPNRVTRSSRGRGRGRGARGTRGTRGTRRTRGRGRRGGTRKKK